jgi:ABC-type multidrug transport system fused ATPase/permease subunit
MLTLGIFTLFFIFYYFMLMKTKATSEKREHQENELLLDIDDVLSNSLSIISTKKIDDEKDYLTTKHNVYDTSHEDHLWHNSKGGFLLSVFGSALLVIFVYILLTLYRKKQISSSDTIKLIIIILFFVRYVKTTSQQSMMVITEYGKLAENEANINKLMVGRPVGGTAAAAARTKTDVPITGHIEFKNVSFEYPSKVADNATDTTDIIRSPKILDNVSFKIKPLDRVAIIGTNGSGKSTIIKLVCGFFKPTEGEIRFNGVDIQEIDRQYLRSHISVVSQKVVLFNRPIIDNICYGTNISKEDALKALDRLKIMNVFKKLPQGLDTMAGSRGENLSGGQRQIIYLLRSYLSNKPITIMDEPTAAVDAFHKNYVLQMINEMSKKTTLIVVTHDPSIATTFPMKIYLEGGRVTRIDGGERSVRRE